MFKFDRIDIQRIAVAAVGAVILTATAVGAAVGPAHNVTAAPAQYAETASGAARG